jgi:hypothetical protein
MGPHFDGVFVFISAQVETVATGNALVLAHLFGFVKSSSFILSISASSSTA